MGTKKKTEKPNTIAFSLSAISYKNLKGKIVNLQFDDREDLADILFQNAQSIAMDNFARKLYESDLVEVENPEVLTDLILIVEKYQLYNFRVRSAMKDYINNLIDSSNGTGTE